MFIVFFNFFAFLHTHKKKSGTGTSLWFA